jgi:hypothetical protein
LVAVYGAGHVEPAGSSTQTWPLAGVAMQTCPAAHDFDVALAAQKLVVVVQLGVPMVALPYVVQLDETTVV